MGTSANDTEMTRDELVGAVSELQEQVEDLAENVIGVPRLRQFRRLGSGAGKAADDA